MVRSARTLGRAAVWAPEHVVTPIAARTEVAPVTSRRAAPATAPAVSALEGALTVEGTAR